MTYDLYFTSRGRPPDLGVLREHFAGREHYGVSEAQASYDNPETGVYFHFDFRGAGPGDGREVPISFHLNFFRPHVFGLEAEPEVAALVEAFDLQVSDPQSEGMGEGAYSRAGFLRGWDHGNAFAVRALLSLDLEGREPIRALPMSCVRGVWRWNQARAPYMDRIGELDLLSCYAPTVYLMEPKSSPGEVFTAVLWAEAMPLALPEVDVVLAASSPEEPMRLVPLDELRPHFAGHPARGGEFAVLDGGPLEVGLRHWLIESPGPALVEALATRGAPAELVRLSADMVLDRELVESAEAARSSRMN